MNNHNKSALAVETYHIDPIHSTVTFKVKHMLINHSIGRFNKFKGEVAFDPHHLNESYINISIEAESVDTHNMERDSHLKAPDFFDTAKYSTITFNSTSITKHIGSYGISGDLTIKGVTKKISLSAQIEGPVKSMHNEDVIGITGEIAINRKDFGISFDKTVDNGKKPMVDDQVKIDINIEAKK